MNKELRSYEEQLVGLKRTLETTEKRALEAKSSITVAKKHAVEAKQLATDAQQRADTLQQETLELRETHATLIEELGEAKRGVERERERSQRLAAQVRVKEEDPSSLSESLARAEEKLNEQCSKSAMKMEAIQKEATLDCYRSIETEQSKWEARERRLI